mmetsp:Transcript_13255/g.22555  ORF Transcript_13255/g.22555 Transcript_13255/m.22555 type:complete len:83 (+) Transcript_13255:704-952(+)
MTEKSLPSDQVVSDIMKKGLEDMVVSTGAGLLVGGLAAVVLARGGASGARKAIAGFGGGVGLGTSWQRSSIRLEDIIIKESN